MTSVCLQILKAIGGYRLLVATAAVIAGVVQAEAALVARPSGGVTVEISAKAFQRSWRDTVADKLRKTLLQELSGAFPFVDWEGKTKKQVVFRAAIRDDEYRGVILEYRVQVRENLIDLKLLPHQLFSIHGPKPAEEKGLHDPAIRTIDDDFANDAVVAAVFSKALVEVVLAEQIYAGPQRVVVPLPFDELRMQPKSRLRVDLTSKLGDDGPVADGILELTPLHHRRSEPDTGAVEGTLDVLNFPNLPLPPDGSCPPQLATLVQKPPAERVEVYVAEFVKRPVYDTDKNGNSRTPR